MKNYVMVEVSGVTILGEELEQIKLNGNELEIWMDNKIAATVNLDTHRFKYLRTKYNKVNNKYCKVYTVVGK